MPLKRDEIQRPILPRELVSVPELGGDGEVFVQRMMLKDRLKLASEGGYDRMGVMLAATVVDADNVPIFTAEEWEIFGGEHYEAAFKLFDVASRLSGMVPEAEKKEEAPS